MGAKKVILLRLRGPETAIFVFLKIVFENCTSLKFPGGGQGKSDVKTGLRIGDESDDTATRQRN